MYTYTIRHSSYAIYEHETTIHLLYGIYGYAHWPCRALAPPFPYPRNYRAIGSYSVHNGPTSLISIAARQLAYNGYNPWVTMHAAPGAGGTVSRYNGGAGGSAGSTLEAGGDHWGTGGLVLRTHRRSGMRDGLRCRLKCNDLLYNFN